MFIKKQDDNLYTWAVLGAVTEALYCLLIGWAMPKIGQLVGNGNGIFQVAPFLLVLVFSVSISGVCLLGYPVYLAMDKKYTKAIKCVLVSLATLFIIGLGILLINLYIK